ncbi:zinc transporter 6 [Histomonas meleagridis]|uniref:zinc transporter 6 n=1 Tax=Histomonas meleagridis TaxID=135588 RepID=UPI00355AB990|nr:zinc transporter 6 [Histomonas meleagridis]KAH0803890.1 zinc transporter 6 [Histomonas meleagridis]
MSEDEDLDLSPLVLQEINEQTSKPNDISSFLTTVTSKGNEQKVIFLTSIFLAFYFICLVLYSAFTKNSPYVSTAFTQLMHSILLAITLVADYYSTLYPDERHTYGYSRATIVASFAVSFSIILLAFSLLLEALKNFLQNTTSTPTDIRVISSIIPHIVVFISYVIPAFLLRNESKNPSLSHTPHFHAAFLVFLSGSMHSLAHFCSGYTPFLKFTGEVSEQISPLFHGLVALFIIDRAKRLLYPSFLVLMQATPSTLLEVIDSRLGETVIDRMIREASHFEGVLECKSAHFWGITFTEYVGSLHIRVKNDANEQHVIAQAHSKFDPIVHHFTAQVEKDHWDYLDRASSPEFDDELDF